MPDKLEEETAMKKEFFEWLAKKVPPAQLSESFIDSTKLDSYCQEKELVSNTFFCISSRDKVMVLRSRLESDSIFKFFYRGKIKKMITVLEYYAQYLDEKREREVTSVHARKIEEESSKAQADMERFCEYLKDKENTQEEISELSNVRKDVVSGQMQQMVMDGVNGDPLVLLATEHGIPWIDKRNAGGSFWMIGNRELMDTLEELRKKGYVFNYAPAGSKSTDRRNAWFLRRIESSTEKSSIRQSAQTGVEQSHTRNVVEQAEENLVDNAIKRQRDAFYEWLRTRSGSYKKNSTENYLKLRKCEKILKNIGVIHCDIFEMADSDKIAQIQKSMTIMLREGHVDSQNTLICTQALRCYQHFLDEVACGKNRIPEKAIVSCDDKANESAMNNGSVKEEKLSEKLQELLQDDDLKPLRDALKMQKITTILQLQKTNLWRFMNSQALYNVGQRQEIFRRLMERMKKKQDCEPAQQYSLKTENQTYLGATPAEALLEYCECIATKYPLKFRSLLDKPYNGGTVVLSRIDKTGDSLKMMNPVAFIGRELVCQDALLYAKWICKTCGETDEPQCMAEPEAKFVVVSEKEPRLEEVNEQAIADVDIQKNQTSSWKESGKAELPVGNKSPLMQMAEGIILAADLRGMTLEELNRQLNTTMVTTKKRLQNRNILFRLTENLSMMRPLWIGMKALSRWKTYWKNCWIKTTGMFLIISGLL